MKRLCYILSVSDRHHNNVFLWLYQLDERWLCILHTKTLEIIACKELLHVYIWSPVTENE